MGSENMDMGQIRDICGEFAKQSEKMGIQGVKNMEGKLAKADEF